MSHSMGTVFGSEGKALAYFEYDGTSDVAIPRLYKSKDEVWEAWRSWPDAECICGKESMSVCFHADYGSGIEWWGNVCLNEKCMCITSGSDPYATGSSTYDYWGSYPNV